MNTPLFSDSNWPGKSSLPIGFNAYTYGSDAQCVNYTILNSDSFQTTEASDVAQFQLRSVGNDI